MLQAVKRVTRIQYIVLLAIPIIWSSAPLAGCSASDKPPHPGKPTKTEAPRLGTNLREVADWSTQRPFVDLFKQARPWLTQCDNARDLDCNGQWDTGEDDRLDLDEHGWVRSLPAPQEPGFSIAGTVLAVPDGFPNGRYILRYDGEGTLRFNLGARLLEAESAPGRAVLDIDVSRGPIHIQILETDPAGNGDYLRNLRLVAEADESRLGRETFNPDFLDRTRPFQALRFMEWQKINGSPVAHWDQRPQPDDATYTGGGGVPLEVMLDLANALGLPPWLNIPHQADDDYVARMAALTRDRLGKRLPVYIEYSNEVWNGAFGQQHWIGERAEATWPGGTASGFTKVMNWYGQRTAEVCDIWRTVFGKRADRVICVMGAQAANAWTADQALRCPLSQSAPCVAHGIDAIAIAPYIGGYLGSPANQGMMEELALTGDLELLFTELNHGGIAAKGPLAGGLAQVEDWVTASMAVAEQHGVDLIGYEGGQHLVGVNGVENSAEVTELFIAANRDPRMGQLYADYLQTWERLGGGLMMHFSDIATPSRHGSWGALEDVGQDTSPKYDALMDYLRPEQSKPGS